MLHLETMNTALLCPECGKPLHIFTQPALLPTQTVKEYAHCLNETCKHWYDTQRLSYYEALLKGKETK